MGPGPCNRACDRVAGGVPGPDADGGGRRRDCAPNARRSGDRVQLRVGRHVRGDGADARLAVGDVDDGVHRLGRRDLRCG